MSDETKIVDPRKVSMLGVDVNIADILGDKLVNQYIAQMTPEQTQALFEFVSEDLFTIEKRLTEDGEYVDKIKVKTERRDSYGYTKYDEQSIGAYIKRRFNERIKEKLVAAVNEVIDSDAYAQNIDKIADDLVAYAVEGYKVDLKERLKERLVNNVADPTMYVGGVNIRNIVRQEIMNIVGR